MPNQSFNEGFLKPQSDSAKSGGLKILPKPKSASATAGEAVTKGSLVGLNSNGAIQIARRSPTISKYVGASSDTNVNMGNFMKKLQGVNKFISLYRRDTPQQPYVFCETTNSAAMTKTKGTEVLVEAVTTVAAGIEAMSDKLAFAIYSSGGALRGVVVENTTGDTVSVKTPANVVASGYSDHGVIVRLSDTQAVVFWRDTSNQLKGVIVTIDPVAFTFSVGTELLIDTSNSYRPRPALLEGGILVLAYAKSDGTNHVHKVRLLSYTGSVLSTLGSVLDIISKLVAARFEIAKFNDNTIAYNFYDNSFGQQSLVITRNGSVLTAGTPYTWPESYDPSGAATLNERQVIDLRAPTHGVITLTDSGALVKGTVFTSSNNNICLDVVDSNTYYAHMHDTNVTIYAYFFKMTYQAVGAALENGGVGATVKYAEF